MASPRTAPPPVPPGIPPLKHGDRLTREEFERRYDAMPDLKKAELIEGVVYMPSPVSWNKHAAPHADLITLFGVYRAATPGVRAGDNGSLRLETDSMPQPDATLIVLPSHGGQVVLSEDDYIEGAPELVAEVSASSVALDLGLKFRVYRRNRVREYLVWRILDAAIDWFVLRGEQYERLPLSPAGMYQSEAFPGLWLDAAALARYDLAAVLQGLQQGIASPEHAAFAARLRQAFANP